MDYVGQIFGNREIVKNQCVDSDWTLLGLRIPTRPDKYVLTRCLNCGTIIPCEISNLHRYPPKRCVLCSNIGNHSKVEPKTNTWVSKNDIAICNVKYKDEIISFYIDIDNYEDVSQYTWRISKKRSKYYVITGSFKKGTMRYLHNLIIGDVPDGYEIDHIDGNSLNNMSKNLRIVNRQENVDNQRATRIDNQIGIRGIVYNRANKKYQVDFNYHKNRFYTKDWKSIQEAVWCRYCFEEYFGLTLIKNNPLANQYDTLSAGEKEEIHQYVLKQILRNERYNSLHPNKQLPKHSKKRV